MKAKITMGEREKCPWKDYDGNELFEGDTIVHPSGQSGIIKTVDDEHPGEKWRVDYSDGTLSRLCLQIGDKGRAVKDARAHGIEIEE